MILLRDVLKIIPKECGYTVFRADMNDKIVLETDLHYFRNTEVIRIQSSPDVPGGGLYIVIDPFKEKKSDEAEENDVIKKPLHYTFRGTEAIKAVDIMTAKATGRVAYLIGCVVKYLYRYPMKNGAQDLDKAIQCLKMLREYLYGYGKPKE
ncbi:DUF3310 domain-containing protein [Acidaminococcus sp.]|uniref:DUF3310 domain-containing protein n=1 Tax=Acidaminococcus sp. TaxID=1872103 RepID=UPI003D7E74A4